MYVNPKYMYISEITMIDQNEPNNGHIWNKSNKSCIYNKIKILDKMSVTWF